MKLVRCNYDSCERHGSFALFELREDLTKVWKTNICRFHEGKIVDRNQQLKKEHDIIEFQEVFE